MQPIQFKRTTPLLIAAMLICFGLFSKAQAVSPTPDGSYPGANTAEGGAGALFSLITGTNNTALGSQALFSLTTGVQNTATGAQALKNNVANDNTANGFQTLHFNTNGDENVATGWRALYENTAGAHNTADGSRALYNNINGGNNTAVGFEALSGNTHGGVNTAVGVQALLEVTTGFNNIGLGFGAGSALTTGDDNIDIGNEGVAGEAETIRIGDSRQTRTFIAGIRDTTTGSKDTVPVIVDANGQLGTKSSSARFKKDVRPMDRASESILALKPVTFHYKSDNADTPQFGLVAEEVEKVNPDLVAHDKKGKPYTVRYDAVNAMLLNEFLKAYHKVQQQEATIAQLKKDFRSKLADQQKQIKALASGLEKMSAQLEASKGAPQMAFNNH